MTAPTFVTVLPPDNTLVAAPEIALSGEVAGARSVTVDGLACTLTVEAFACPSCSLTDGERIFTLLARDAAGNEAPRQHRIRRDGTGPEVVIATPVAGAYLASANVAVNGTAVDPHLAEVRVNGVLADLAGDAWSAGPISLAEGAATIEVIARDTVDNGTVVSRSVTIDTVAPEVELLESGTPLGDGALFNRTVTPVIEVADASPWTLVATLDGAAYLSGTPIAGEGLHVLQATATDSAGNPGTRQVSFRVDGSPPALVAISPADGFVTAEAEVHLQGQILGAETLTIDGVEVTLLGDQFIAGPFSLAEGEAHVRDRGARRRRQRARSRAPCRPRHHGPDGCDSTARRERALRYERGAGHRTGGGPAPRLGRGQRRGGCALGIDLGRAAGAAR